MHRTRSLIVVAAATTLTFTGISTAAAGGGGGHHDDDELSAEVVSIADTADANDEGTEVAVTFTYECDGDEDDITTEVALKQDGSWFRYVDDSDRNKFELDCDGTENDATVTLEKHHGDALENGYAWAGVRLEDEDGDELDTRWEKVKVSGVDDDDDHDKHEKRGHH